LNIFFDIQGTLISGGKPRPHVREVFLKLSGLGHHIYLWSSAGGNYASNAAKLLGVEDLTLGCYSKNDPIPVTVDIVVDDQPGFADYYKNGYTILPFNGDSSDSELCKVLESIQYMV